MKEKLVIVTDLGSFKAYRWEEDPLHSSPRLELVESFDTVDAHGKLSEKLTDQAGQFPRGTGTPLANSDMSNGERHNIELELRKRLIKQLAKSVCDLVRPDRVDQFYFAAAQEINRQIVDEIPPQCRSKLRKNVTCNLTKADRDQLLKHFNNS